MVNNVCGVRAVDVFAWSSRFCCIQVLVKFVFVSVRGFASKLFSFVLVGSSVALVAMVSIGVSARVDADC